jgi:hypothetical protein
MLPRERKTAELPTDTVPPTLLASVDEVVRVTSHAVILGCCDTRPMSALAPGCVKTWASRECAELFSPCCRAGRPGTGVLTNLFGPPSGRALGGPPEEFAYTNPRSSNIGQSTHFARKRMFRVIVEVNVTTLVLAAFASL